MNNITRYQQPLLYYSLFHAGCHTGLELELQKELADLDAFQRLIDQSLINPRDGSRLRIDEIHQFPDSLLTFVLM